MKAPRICRPVKVFLSAPPKALAANMAGYVTYLEKTSTLITMYSTQNSLYFDMLDTSNPSFKKACTFGKWKETTESMILFFKILRLR